MRKACCTFLSVANKSAKKPLSVSGIFLFLGTASLLGGIAAPLALAQPVPIAEATPVGIATSETSPSPSPSPTPDLTSLQVLPLVVAQKNPNKAYQIGDRISLLVEMKGNLAESGAHLSLDVPEGSSKLEDQGWYVDPSTQFLNGVFQFIVSPIQTGNLTLPTLLISREDHAVIGRTAPFTIDVTGPEKKDKSELIDITTSTLPTKYWILFSLLALLVMAGVSYGIYRFLKTRRKKPKFLPQKPNELEHVLALRKIESLYQSFPYRIENLKPITFGVSETLKEFFSSRFKIDATEATTDEMIELLRKEAVAGENLREIQTLFQDLDLVKFTKSENYSHYDEAKYLDLKTKAQLIVQKWKMIPPSTGGQTS